MIAFEKKSYLFFFLERTQEMKGLDTLLPNLKYLELLLEGQACQARSGVEGLINHCPSTSESKPY